MTDIPKVITTLTPVRLNSDDISTNSRTYSKSPESDRPIFLNTNGFVETHLPPIRGGFQLVTNCGTLDNVQRYSSLATALTGSYFTAADLNPIDPSALGPQITILINNQAGAVRTWTFPTLTQMATYLRGAYPDLYRPGLYWEITFINHSTTNNLILSIPAAIAVNPQSYRIWGLAGTTTKTVGPNTSTTVGFLVEGTQPGSEKFSFFIIAS